MTVRLQVKAIFISHGRARSFGRERIGFTTSFRYYKEKPAECSNLQECIEFCEGYGNQGVSGFHLCVLESQ
jgi:hypothetical protein